MPHGSDAENTTQPALGPEAQKRASTKIAHMMREGGGKRPKRTREQIIAIGIQMARDGKLGPRGGYSKS